MNRRVSVWTSLFFLILIWQIEFCGSRRGGGRGGSLGRGSSSSKGRSGSSGTRGNYGGKSKGSFGRGGGRSTFSKGSGLGSLVRGNKFKSIVAGAAAGYITYKLGKGLIKAAASPMMWGGRSYYWGSNYYQRRSGYEMCSMPVQQGDGQFGNVFFQDGRRPQDITWSCRSYTEYCCGYECCPTNRGRGWMGIGFGVVIVLLLMLCCFGFLLYKFFRKSLDCILGSNNPDQQRAADGSKFDDIPINSPPAPVGYQPTFAGQQPQSYPMQPFPSQPYYPPQQQPPPYG